MDSGQNHQEESSALHSRRCVFQLLSRPAACRPPSLPINIHGMHNVTTETSDEALICLKGLLHFALPTAPQVRTPPPDAQ